jgi:gamma-tubulin complex component 4
MVVAEILLVLAGHDSSLFEIADTSTPPTIAAAFADLLHPGEKVELEALARISWRYKKIKAAYRSLLRPSKAGQTSPYMAALFVCLNDILKSEYEALIIETEARILKKDESFVASGSFVPLSAIRATFSEWDAPLAALESLLDHLALLPDGTRPNDGQRVHWPPGKLIDLLINRSETGVERVASIMSRLGTAVQRVWRLHLTAFLIHGTLSTSDPIADANAAYSLVSDAIPSCVSSRTREYI